MYSKTIVLLEFLIEANGRYQYADGDGLLQLYVALYEHGLIEAYDVQLVGYWVESLK